uniref:Uncharacterized protein n=2 Tax=Pyramimonas obovata TaxID=1411642 RepID=A0A7S0N4J0_9CHLO|mmetsp:Transcript_2012/g.4084  ORF Transcript_2012/g.4084 Transcript_2012/m.4084 type:complete len:441 (+) Transcript_2012:63-1385(+)
MNPVEVTSKAPHRLKRRGRSFSRRKADYSALLEPEDGGTSRRSSLLGESPGSNKPKRRSSRRQSLMSTAESVLMDGDPGGEDAAVRGKLGRRSSFASTVEGSVDDASASPSRRGSIAETTATGEEGRSGSPTKRAPSKLSKSKTASMKKDGTKVDKYGKSVNLNLISGFVKDEETMDEADWAEVGKTKMDKKALKLIHFMRLFANSFSITCDMLMSLLGIVGNGGFCTNEGIKARDSYRVNAVLAFYEYLIDRAAFSHVMRSLNKEEQVAVAQRLGWMNLLDMRRPDGIFYYLRIAIPEERAVANKLNKLAVRIKEPRSCWEGLACSIHGVWRPLYVKEDANMWSTILVSSHALVGDLGLICFTFTGTKAPIHRHHVVMLQKTWRMLITRNWFRRMRLLITTIQTRWKNKFRRRKIAQRWRKAVQEAERRVREQNAEDFW